MPTAEHFLEMKRQGVKIVSLTAYDAPTARLIVEAGTDIILVGDSVGVNILGYPHERDVTLTDMAHHIAAVRRGAPDVYIIGDLPYASYDTPQQAMISADLLRRAGASCIKFEGARPEITATLANAGFDVCCHLGLESQHHALKRRQGKDAVSACKLFDDAIALDKAGQKFLVLELVPRELAYRITNRINAVTIGIGAGADTNGQVLVVNDLAGITRRKFKHNRQYGAIGHALREAVASYARDVRMGAFPTTEQTFTMAAEEFATFERIRP